jgi:hypothetical protein
MRQRTIAIGLFTLGALLSLGTVASAQRDPHTLGTVHSGFTTGITARPQLTDIFLTASYANASYGTGGVATRNRSTGGISISGVSGTTQAAWIYWAVLLHNPTSAQLTNVSKVTVTRMYPPGAPSSAAVVGTLLNIGGDPCWGSTGAYVFRAAVPTYVATGNGFYKVALGGASLKDGEDPWDGNVRFPLFEGASLIIVGQGSNAVGLLDGQAGTTFSSTYQNYYQLPATISGTSRVLLENIGYDGQLGSSRTASLANETSFAEGWPNSTSNIQFAGPGGEATDSDWDGSSGWPLPQLWDDTGHDISNAFVAGDYWVLVTYNSFGDCLGTVAAVVSVSP